MSNLKRKIKKNNHADANGGETGGTSSTNRLWTRKNFSGSNPSRFSFSKSASSNKTNDLPNTAPLLASQTSSAGYGLAQSNSDSDDSGDNSSSTAKKPQQLAIPTPSNAPISLKENLPTPPNATHEKIKLVIALINAVLSGVLYFTTTDGVALIFRISCLLANFGFDTLAAYSTQNAITNPDYGNSGIFSEEKTWKKNPRKRLLALAVGLGALFSLPAPIIVASAGGNETKEVLSAAGNGIGTFFLYVYACLNPARGLRNIWNYYFNFRSTAEETDKRNNLYTVEKEILATLSALEKEIGDGRYYEGIETDYPLQNDTAENQASSTENSETTSSGEDSNFDEKSALTDSESTNISPSTSEEVAVASEPVSQSESSLVDFDALPTNVEDQAPKPLTLAQKKLLYLAAQAAQLDSKPKPSPCCAHPITSPLYWLGYVGLPILSCIASSGYAAKVGLAIGAGLAAYWQLPIGIAFNLGMFSLSAQSAIGLFTSVINWFSNPAMPLLLTLLGPVGGSLAMLALAYLGGTSGASGQNLQENSTMPLLNALWSGFQAITTGTAKDIFSWGTFGFICSTNLFYIMGAAAVFYSLYLAFSGTPEQKRSVACKKELENFKNELEGSPDRTEELLALLKGLDEAGITVVNGKNEAILPSKAFLRDKVSRAAYRNYFKIGAGVMSEMSDMSKAELPGEVIVDIADKTSAANDTQKAASWLCCLRG